ncbi:MAG: electron transport complex subunit RsxG [Deltaproteobacteria bacterium]|nr:electron transport complex subunit RsxG [Deltaproteobacteria bacterium]
MQSKLPAVVSSVLLGLFGVLGAGLVAISHQGTAERIARNEREVLLRQLEEMLPRAQIDNDMLTDIVEVSAPEALGAAMTRVYRGWYRGQPVAAVFSPVIAQGYSGPIRLIVAVRYDGTLAGVRVLAHRETPGLGDKIEVERSDWILDFAGKSLLNPPPSAWAVKRDGGQFDQFTGATVTPRAVVRGLKASLEYFNDKKLQLFEQPQPQESAG